MSGRCRVWEHLRIGVGTTGDYAALRDFHYRSGPPGAVKRIFVARYDGPGLGGEDAAHGMRAGVIVESLPSLGCTLRTVALPGRFQCGNRSLDAARLNRDLRTISRVIVHPIFRSVGLAVKLVEHLLAHAETPYVEALAAMGRVHPFFERAGMRAFDRPALPAAVRLLAAMEREGVRAIDWVDPERLRLSPFLLAELQRFAGKKVAPEKLIGFVRQRLLSQPVYYIWARGETGNCPQTATDRGPHNRIQPRACPGSENNTRPCPTNADGTAVESQMQSPCPEGARVNSTTSPV